MKPRKRRYSFPASAGADGDGGAAAAVAAVADIGLGTAVSGVLLCLPSETSSTAAGCRSRRGRSESCGCRAGHCSALRRSWSAKTRNYSFPVCYFPVGGDSSRRTTRRGDQMRRRREERTTRSRRVGGRRESLKAGGCRPRGGAYSRCFQYS